NEIEEKSSEVIEISNEPEPQVLDQKKWVVFTLTSRMELTDNALQLRFSPKDPEMQKLNLGLPVGMHVMIRGTGIEGKKVIRAYTPMNNQFSDFILVIRVYKPCEKFPLGGQLSQILDGLSIGGEIDVKG